MLDFLRQPWPWYVAGPLIGLTVPLLLLLGNKPFGISSTLRHVCAACIPGNISFFKYNWRAERWNLYFVLGIFLGGVLSATLLVNPNPVAINPQTVLHLQALGIQDFSGLGPAEIFSWSSLTSIRGLIFTVVGGLLVGFGTRYASGCTSGHSIFGLATLQWPSLVATLAFMAGGFLCTHLILPYIL